MSRRDREEFKGSKENQGGTREAYNITPSPGSISMQQVFVAGPWHAWISIMECLYQLGDMFQVLGMFPEVFEGVIFLSEH